MDDEGKRGRRGKGREGGTNHFHRSFRHRLVLVDHFHHPHRKVDCNQSRRERVKGEVGDGDETIISFSVTRILGRRKRQIVRKKRRDETYGKR